MSLATRLPHSSILSFKAVIGMIGSAMTDTPPKFLDLLFIAFVIEIV